ncbi:hypothetical protein LPJ73_004292, partial [Coemansia sp. RSA 2703]
ARQSTSASKQSPTKQRSKRSVGSTTATAAAASAATHHVVPSVATSVGGPTAAGAF